MCNQSHIRMKGHVLKHESNSSYPQLQLVLSKQLLYIRNHQQPKSRGISRKFPRYMQSREDRREMIYTISQSSSYNKVKTENLERWHHAHVRIIRRNLIHSGVVNNFISYPNPLCWKLFPRFISNLNCTLNPPTETIGLCKFYGYVSPCILKFILLQFLDDIT